MYNIPQTKHLSKPSPTQLNPSFKLTKENKELESVKNLVESLEVLDEDLEKLGLQELDLDDIDDGDTELDF